MTEFAYDRAIQGLPVPGVIEVGTDVRLGQVIDDLLLVANCSLDGELEGQIHLNPTYTGYLIHDPKYRSVFNQSLKN